MNEELLEKFCNTCAEFCDTHELGIYMVLTHREGLVHLNKFPAWSVLQHVDSDEKIELTRDETELATEWFDRLQNTIVFLEEFSKDTSTMGKLSNNLKELLEVTLSEVLEEHGVVKKTSPLLH
jgi:hypothetical protein